MNAGKTDIPLGTRIRIVKSGTGNVEDSEGCFGEVGDVLSGYNADRFLASLTVDWPPHKAGRVISIVDGDQIEIVKEIQPRYRIEFVRELIVLAMKAMGVAKPDSGIVISETVDLDTNTGTPLRCIDVNTGFCDFSIYETVISAPKIETEHVLVCSPERMVGYFAYIARSAGGTSINDPPDVAEWESKATYHPSSAIKEAILKCAAEAIDNRCYDEILYRDWLEEQGQPNGA